ncbi:CAP domain-containing protein [Tautonia sociabilis]|nr:CAP domain-containing protein [Tautonia sociabilis]
MRLPARPTGPPSLAWIALLPAALGLLPMACGGLPKPPAGTPRVPTERIATPIRLGGGQTGPDALGSALLERHNAIRTARGLPPLSWSPTLADAAREHSSGLVSLGRLRHKGHDGSSPADRVERRGYAFRSVGENIASGQETVEEVMEGWMNSPGHRRNILGDFEELGASRREDEGGRPYWCVVFATPLP